MPPRPAVSPLDVPAYSVAAVARWVGVPYRTLHQWVYGRDYRVGGQAKHTGPLIEPADPDRGLLSFNNVAEAHMLDAFRKHGYPMLDVRSAIEFARRAKPDTPHPLIAGAFSKRGKYLVVDYLSDKVVASRPLVGQALLAELDIRLDRIEVDDRRKVMRLFPLRRNENKTVVLNSGVAGGQPIIAGTGILVEYVQELHNLGYPAVKIAAQYGLDESKVAEAINFIAA